MKLIRTGKQWKRVFKNVDFMEDNAKYCGTFTSCLGKMDTIRDHLYISIGSLIPIKTQKLRWESY